MSKYSDEPSNLTVPCIEIVSPSNSDDEMQEKTRAYLAAGGKEVWLVSEECSIRYFDANGQKASSDFPVSIPGLPPAPRLAS